MEPMLWTRILEYILITLIPLLVGIIIGGGLGTLLALAGRAIYRSSPLIRKIALILPWRTLLLGLILLVWSPYLVLRMGIGPRVVGLIVGLVIFLASAAVTSTILLEEWVPSPLWQKLLGAVRLFAAAAPVIAAAAGFMNTGGLGFLIIQGARTFRFGIAWQGYLLVVLLVLILDLVLGGVQVLAAFMIKSAGDKPPAAVD